MRLGLAAGCHLVAWHFLRWCNRLPSPRCSPIFRLLGHSLPGDVARLIIAVVVDPTQRMLWRRRCPDISKEVIETLLPSLADLDATTTIAIITLVAWAGASFAHCQPRPIFFRAGSPVCSPTSASTMHRLFKSPLRRPPSSHSRQQRVVADIQKCRPGSDAGNKTVIRDCSRHRYIYGS